MNEHLSPELLSALADGELSRDQLAGIEEHLAGCPQCTAAALAQSLLKSATARAGQRYAPSVQLRERIARIASQAASRPVASPSARTANRGIPYGWGATAAAILIAAATVLVLGRNAQQTQTALVTEASDQHIAMLAANAPPEVISSDRHTVKPWFQGKLPFSFNLPQSLPADTTLDGANLTYLHGQPTAQLLFSIGKHRVSVFVQQRSGAIALDTMTAEHSGFHVAGFRTPELQVVGVSDADPARLADLMKQIEEAQTASR